MLPTLKRREHELARAEKQIQILESLTDVDIPPFSERLANIGMYPLRPSKLEIFQMNVGKMCNQICKHCHVDAGPDRKEIMTRETMQLCLDAIKKSDVHTVDITGGAPEMNPDFRWLIAELSGMKKHIIVRCNLTIIMANPRYHDLPDFFAENKVNVVSSLPHFTARRTDAQRGDGVFEKSIAALKMLNSKGYGKGNPELKLDLVYNPTGAFLPGDQQALEREYKDRLLTDHGITFDNLFCITNIPVSRFLDYLLSSGNYESYMETLSQAFNPLATANVMCRNTLSVGWDGALYDCDFNQMLELKVDKNAPRHIKNFDQLLLEKREIKINQHCYGCTAGAGSSCGGAVV